MTDIEKIKEGIARKSWLAHINHARLSDPTVPEFDEMDFYKQRLINHKMFYDFADQILQFLDSEGLCFVTMIKSGKPN